MSGIFGIYNISSDAVNQELHALDYFNRPYGQDDSGVLLSESMAVGCHIEHFSEHFPSSAPVIEQQNQIAVIDALLYNRDELLTELEIDDAISDEELLLTWIERKGFSALASVNGDFAGAIFDKDKHTWTLFRDHSGVRPLFYYTDDKLFAFSSDMRGLTALPNADMSPNEWKLYARMAGYSALTLCETEYANIHCIRPASWTIIRASDKGFVKTENIYFTWRQKRIRLASDKEYQQELRRLITDAVKRRLDAVPGIVGCELSGGLDSSIIAILINRLGREGRFFSWSYSPQANPLLDGRDERKVIQDICSQESISCHYNLRDESRTIDDVIDELTVPYLNSYTITKGSRYVKAEGCRVMFTGHGGDEGVSHRCNLYELWLHHEYYSFFRNIYRRTKGQNLRFLRTIKNAYHQISTVHPHFNTPFHKVYSNPVRFLRKDFVEKMSAKFEPQVNYFAFRPYRYIMQGGHRVRLDNISVQGASQNIRYLTPYIDYRVLDFALSIPRSQFHNGYTNRYIFRFAFDDIMPQSLRDVHYKDTPSMDNFSVQINYSNDFAERKLSSLKYLDREYWKDYLDIDAIESFCLPADCTRSDYINACYMLSDLLSCCLIQQLPGRSRKRCEQYE